MSLDRVARTVVLGSSALALSAGAIGCSAFREQWPTQRMAREYKPTPQGPVTYAPDVEQGPYNAAALDGLPGGVQASFRRDHPDAAVTAVTQVPSGAGLMLYRIGYVEDGSAGSTTYRAGGHALGADAGPTASQPDLTGRPKAKYAPRPATQPTAAEQVTRNDAAD